MITNVNLSVRLLISEDAQKLTKWLSDPEVLQFYEGRDRPFSIEMVLQDFYKQSDDTNRCIVQWEGVSIGYVQFYIVADKERQAYGLTKEPRHIYGLDQFIGEKEFRDKGIGTKLVQTMVKYLTTERGADLIVMDPQVTNARALACYEKCGFVKKKWLPKHEWHEGEFRDCWLIVYKEMEKRSSKLTTPHHD